MLKHLRRLMTPRTLFARAVPSVIVPLVLLQLLLSYVFYNRHWDNVTGWLASGVAGEVAMLADVFEATQDPAARSGVVEVFRDHTELTVSFEPNGQLAQAIAAAGIDEASISHIDSKILEAFTDKLKRPFAIDLTPDEESRVVIYVQLDDGLMRVTTNRKRVTTTNTFLLLSWMVGGALVLAGVSVYFLRLQLRPLRRLARAAESFGRGGDTGDVRPQGALEIRQAAHAFNLMRHRILRHFAQRTELLAAVSHDLRTPLTRMRLELELCGAESDPTLGELKGEVEEMAKLVDTYLSFARGEAREAVEATALRPLLESLRERVERQGIALDITMDKPVILSLRPVAFKRCLANLVDNASRYARWIGISVSRNEEFIEIAVDDDGPGIPENLWEKVLEPFVRLDGKTAGQDQGQGEGTGLGLTIARDVILGHGGDLKLNRSQRGGLRALVRLPA